MSDLPTIDALKAERGRLMERVNKLDAAIEILSELGFGFSTNGHGQPLKSVTVTHDSAPEWNSKAPLTKKALTILEMNGRFMYVRQIADAARKLGEPEHSPVSKSNLQGRISVILSVLRKAEKVVRIQLGASAETSVWGLPTWTHGNKIKDQYTPMAK